MKESDGEIGKSIIAELVHQDFYSLRPVFYEGDFKTIQKYSSRNPTNARIANDEFEELVADDYFAIFLNQGGEIRVADSVFIYTDDGLFFVHHSNVDHLNNYLDNFSATNGRLAPCDGDDAGSIQRVDDQISRFVSNCATEPALPPDEPGPPAGGGAKPAEKSYEQAMYNFVSGLPPCESYETWTEWIFGTGIICVDNFSSDHRVKTKFWNQNYLLAASIGASVKSQTRTLGVWWSKKVDEIGLGILNAYYDVDIPTPIIPAIAAPITYIYDGFRYDSNGKVQGAAKPQMPFESAIEIYVPLPLHPFNLTYTRKELNDIFWTQVWNQAKSVLKDLAKEETPTVTFVGFLPKKAHVMYSNKFIRQYDDGKIIHYFDFNFRIDLKGKLNDLGIKVKDVSNFYDYSNANIDMFGYGREGETFKGSRLIYEE
jgi:hypothetical protein